MKHRSKIYRASRRRIIGGGFGSSALSPGSHVTRKGKRTNKYKDVYLIYDQAVILPKPVSTPVARAMLDSWIPTGIVNSKKYFAKRGWDQLPIVRAGLLGVIRGRIVQPWVRSEYLSVEENLITEALHDLTQSEKLEALAGVKAKPKSGILGWFLNARTRPLEGASAKGAKRANIKKRKAKKRPSALSRVGRRSKAGLQRRAHKHKLARGRVVRRKRKAPRRKK